MGAGSDYSQLEARQLLAIDFGLNITGSTFGTNSNVINPNMVGDVGTTHAIEAISDRIAIFDKISGAKEIDKTQRQFFIDAGATVGSDQITNSQVVFDRFSSRWLVIGEGAGNGNWIYIAISNTANHANGWKALRFVGDSVGVRHNGELTAGVDADALLITSRNTSTLPGFPLSVSVFTIPRANLYLANPTLTNMSRFENLNPAQYGDYIRAASSFEASNGRATFLGNLGLENTRFDVVGVAAAGATITAPVKLLYNIDPFFPTWNLISNNVPAPDGRQLSDNDIYIDHRSPDIFNNPVDVNGGLWFVQTVERMWTAGSDISSAIVYYEFSKATNALMHAGFIQMPATAQFPDPSYWDMYNPSISVNEFGIVAISYTISSEEYEVDPTAAISVGVTVNGLALYNPFFDAISKPGRNTQFADPEFIQVGLEAYENNGFQPSTWSYRSTTGFDPASVNRFWANVQWANTVDRWSTQVAEARPNRLLAEITADEFNNVIRIRRSAANNDLMEIEIDGNVTDRLPYEVVGRLRLNGFDGADRFIIDYVNGDPVPVDGLEINGMRGPDTIEVNDPNGGRFVVNSNSGGTYNEVSDFINIETLIGGDGNDSFFLTDVIDPDTNQVISSGFIAGSLVGNGGDDLFHFGGATLPPVIRGGVPRPAIGDSVFGGTGNNTLSFESAEFDTFLRILSYGGNVGYSGRTSTATGALAGPIGGDQATDRFNDITYIKGSLTHFDQVWQGGVGVFNAQAEVLVDDENSVFTTGGVDLGFFEINAIGGSTFNDKFVGIRNSVSPLQLDGFAGNDDYYFSSDGELLMGSTSPLQGLLFAQGGQGQNRMWVSNRGGTANTAGLILLNRISGIGEIAYNAIGGNFAIQIWTSEFADHVDLHSFIVTNTLELFLRGGNDRVSVQDLSKAVIKVYGETGDDVYAIEKVQGIDLRNLELIDSVGSERDRVTLVGTILDEVFVIDANTFLDLNVVYTGIEIVGVEAEGGNDRIDILSSGFEIFVDGGSGDDVINIASDAPVNQGDVAAVLENVTVEGGSGRNRLNVSARTSASIKNVTVFDNRITGMLPGTLFYASTGGSFSIAGDVGGIFLTGSLNFADVFTVVGLRTENSLRVHSLGGDDYFIVHPNALGNIRLDGGEGNDRYDVTFLGSGTRQLTMADTGASTSNRLFAYGSSGADTFAVSPTAIIRGGESILIQTSLVFASLASNAGNDLVTVTGGPAPNFHVFGGNDNDIVVINSTTGITGLRVSGDAGNDQIGLNNGLVTTYSQIYGGGNDDKLTVTSAVLGGVEVDGQAGSDTVNVTFVGTGSRFANLSDSGVGGSDLLTLNGNAQANTFSVQPTLVSMGTENVVFSAATERLTINSLGGSDVFNIGGSSAGVTRINAGDAADTFNVNGTQNSPQLTLDGGAADDVFTVRNVSPGSRVTQLGGTGNDLFNVGSDLNGDNGQLDLIRGVVSADGGGNTVGGQDRLYVNDNGSMAPYSYYMGPTSITNLPGPQQIMRPNFAGIFYDASLELARLDGTPLANFFSVKSSADTIYYIDGNSPNPFAVNGDFINLLASSNDGHVLHIISPSLGSGYWDFTNGHEEVRFENIEQTYSPAPPLMMFMMNNGGDQGDDSSNSGIAMMMSNPPGGGGSNLGLAGSSGNTARNDNSGAWSLLFNSGLAQADSADAAFAGVADLLAELV